jgi:hypothetical protein
MLELSLTHHSLKRRHMRLALGQQLLTLQQSHRHMVRQVLVAAGRMLFARHRVCGPIRIVAMGPAGTVLSLACSAAYVQEKQAQKIRVS